MFEQRGRSWHNRFHRGVPWRRTHWTAECIARHIRPTVRIQLPFSSRFLFIFSSLIFFPYILPFFPVFSSISFSHLCHFQSFPWLASIVLLPLFLVFFGELLASRLAPKWKQSKRIMITQCSIFLNPSSQQLDSIHAGFASVFATFLILLDTSMICTCNCFLAPMAFFFS